MSKLFLRAALVGCVATGAAVAQTAPVPTQPMPPPVAAPVLVPTTATFTARVVSPAEGAMILKTFDVADLVCPPADSPLAKPGTDPAMVAAAKAFTEVRAEELKKAVRTGTDRGWWDEYGGGGRMAVTTDGKSLVVNHTPAVMDKVGACVESLRRLRSTMVKVDMVVFTVPSGNEAMVKLFGDKGHAAVSPDEMNNMLRELKASGSVDILTRPTLVLTNKQTGFCQVGEQVPLPKCGEVLTHLPVGMTTRVTPDVSSDLKSVALAFEFEHRECFGVPLPGVNICEGKANVVLPDGGCMAVRVNTRKVERKTETKVPVVGDLPYMGQLFHTVTTTREPTDTVAVLTATRMMDADLTVRPPVAVPPPVMPAAPIACPVPVAMSPTTVCPQPAPTVRVVGPDGLERVGVNFTTLTAADTLPKAVPGVRVAPPAVTLVRLTPDGSCVAGAVIGTALSSTCGTDETAVMMAAYKAACATGQKDEATRLALQLLAKDPTCFGKK